MSKNITAVGWFAGEIKGGKLITNQKFEELLQQANKMFEQQLKDAYMHDRFMLKITSEQYYNEKFKQQEQ